MYKFVRNCQFKFSDFNQTMGLKMNPENWWVIKVDDILWNEIEKRYVKFFSEKMGCLQNRSGWPLAPYSFRSSMGIPTGNWWSNFGRIYTISTSLVCMTI